MKSSQTVGCKPSGQRKFNLRISILNVIVKHYYEVSHTSRYRKLGSPACVLFIGLQVSPCQMLGNGHTSIIDFVTFRRRHSLLSAAISVRSIVLLLLVVKLNAVCVTQLKQLVRLSIIN